MLDKITLKIIINRLTQRLFNRRLSIAESWEKTPSQFSNFMDFLSWFDKATTQKEYVETGKRDWNYRFKSHNEFKNLKHSNCLEIGFGAGRLLAHAAKDFEKAYGVDIHSNFNMSRKFINAQDVSNYVLLHKNELDKIQDESIEYIYSFIVFQHFDSITEVEFYLKEIDRMLTKSGIAHIYYGKNKINGVTVTSADNFRLRDCSLFINPANMRDLIKSRFELIDYEDSLPRDPVSKTGESVQSMILFRKKNADK